MIYRYRAFGYPRTAPVSINRKYRGLIIFGSGSEGYINAFNIRCVERIAKADRRQGVFLVIFKLIFGRDFNRFTKSLYGEINIGFALLKRKAFLVRSGQSAFIRRTAEDSAPVQNNRSFLSPLHNAVIFGKCFPYSAAAISAAHFHDLKA